MENKQHIELRSYATQNEAEEIVALLKKQNIPAKITKDSGDLDYVLQGELPVNKFEVHILEDDAERAEMMLIDLANENIEGIDKDYYLFSFSNEELIDVVVQKNEWSEFDVILSQKILKERGVEISKDELSYKREQRNEELQQPEKGQTGWIIFGYIASILGGFLGILIGYSLWTAKKKTPNGKQVPAYGEHVRSHGQRIFYIGIFMLVTAGLIRLFLFIEK